MEFIMRRQRIMAGVRRIGIILGLILSVPVFFALWTRVTLGHPPPRYVYVFLLVGLGAYIAVTTLPWIIAAFTGEDEDAVVPIAASEPSHEPQRDEQPAAKDPTPAAPGEPAAERRDGTA
jgi:hypothetical protein